MNKLMTVLGFIFLFCLTACEQQEDVYKLEKADFYFEKINSIHLKNEAKEKYIDTLYHYLLTQNNDSLNRALLFKTAKEYLTLNKSKVYLETVLQVNELAVSAKDTSAIAKSLCYIGDYYENSTQIDSAFKYYSKSQKLFKSINDTLNVGRLTLYSAGILYDAGIFTESEIETTHALHLLIHSGNDQLIYESYNLMALNLDELGNYNQAFSYYNMALNQLDVLEKNDYLQEKLNKSRAIIHNNIGNIFTKQTNFSTALSYYNQGLISKKTMQDYPKLHAMLLDNLAYAKMKAGLLTDVERLFETSRKIRDSLQIKSGIVTGTIHLGEYYIQTNDLNKGIAYLKNGYSKAKEIESTYDVKNALKLLSLYDKSNSNFYTKRYIEVTDSLQSIERITRNKFARIAFETDQIQEKNENLVKKYTKLMLLSGLSILFVVILFIVYRLQTKNKELQFIQTQQESNEKIYQLILQQQQQNQSVRDEERNRIAMELHDGIVNRIFTSRFNLMQLQPEQVEKKELLIQELIAAETEIRKVSHDLQQNLLFEDNSFQKTLGALVLSQSNTYQTVFDFSIDTYIDWNLVSNENKVHIYRISQEALQNVNKYAHATKCFIFIMKKGTQISLQIIDNGIGFETDKIKTGIGLKNMQQRASNMGGRLQITSKPEGTTLEVLF